MSAGAVSSVAAEHAEAGPAVPMAAPTLFHIGPLPVTNTIVVTWIILAFIFAVIKLGTRKLSLVPTGLQNLLEMVVEGLEDMTKGLLEPKVVHWCFPLVATFFLFILIANLTDLLALFEALFEAAPFHVRDVFHTLRLFKCFNFLLHFAFEPGCQHHNPVHEAVKVQDQPAGVTALMPQLGERGFPNPALAQRPLSLQRLNLRQNDDGKGIGVLEQLRLVLGQVKQLDHREFHPGFAAPKFLLVERRLPPRMFVGQDGQALATGRL